jgi:hypothetical protein
MQLAADEKRSLDADEASEYDELDGQVTAIKEHLARLQRFEQSDMDTATSVGRRSVDGAPRILQRKHSDADEAFKGQLFVRKAIRPVGRRSGGPGRKCDIVPRMAVSCAVRVQSRRKSASFCRSDIYAAIPLDALNGGRCTRALRCVELRTVARGTDFNPLVAGSIPARPTNPLIVHSGQMVRVYTGPQCQGRRSYTEKQTRLLANRWTKDR